MSNKFRSGNTAPFLNPGTKIWDRWVTLNVGKNVKPVVSPNEELGNASKSLLRCQ
jgi:hypothetical protein